MTLLPGGEPLPQQPGPRGAAAKAQHAGDGAAAGAAVAVAGPPSKARRASDTGSAPRPPLPPHRSRLGGQPPTPTQASAGHHGAGGHNQSPFASLGAAATAAAADAVPAAQQAQLGAHPQLSQLGSAQGSSRVHGSGLAGVPATAGSFSGSVAPPVAVADPGRVHDGHGASGAPALTPPGGGGGLPSTAAAALRARGESGDEVDMADAP